MCHVLSTCYNDRTSGAASVKWCGVVRPDGKDVDAFLVYPCGSSGLSLSILHETKCGAGTATLVGIGGGYSALDRGRVFPCMVASRYYSVPRQAVPMVGVLTVLTGDDFVPVIVFMVRSLGPLPVLINLRRAVSQRRGATPVDTVTFTGGSTGAVA